MIKLQYINLSEVSFLCLFKKVNVSSSVSSFILIKGLKTSSELFDNLVFSFTLFHDKHLELLFSVKQDSLYSQLKLKALLIKVTQLLAKLWVPFWLRCTSSSQIKFILVLLF